MNFCGIPLATLAQSLYEEPIFSLCFQKRKQPLTKLRLIYQDHMHQVLFLKGHETSSERPWRGPQVLFSPNLNYIALFSMTGLIQKKHTGLEVSCENHSNNISSINKAVRTSHFQRFLTVMIIHYQAGNLFCQQDPLFSVQGLYSTV